MHGTLESPYHQAHPLLNAASDCLFSENPLASTANSPPIYYVIWVCPWLNTPRSLAGNFGLHVLSL